MKRLSLIIFIAISAMILLSASASAASSMISNITISGDILHNKINITPQTNTYTIYLSAPGTITIAVRADAGILLTSEDSSGFGSMSFSRNITAERTIISITARGNSAQTIALIFVLQNTTPPQQPDPPDPPLPSDPDDQPPQPPAPDDPDDKPNDDNYHDNDDDNYHDDNYYDDNNHDDEDDEDDTPDRGPVALTLQIGNPIMEVNGVPLLLDSAPILLPPGHTMVPVRFITEALGGEVAWIPEQRKVELWLDGKYFSLIIGQTVPGTNVAAMIQNSRTLVPLRFVMENFGAQVQWFGGEKVIFILYPAPI